jgi:hypothetical protein
LLYFEAELTFGSNTYLVDSAGNEEGVGGTVSEFLDAYCELAEGIVKVKWVFDGLESLLAKMSSCCRRTFGMSRGNRRNRVAHSVRSDLRLVTRPRLTSPRTIITLTNKRLTCGWSEIFSE